MDAHSRFKFKFFGARALVYGNCGQTDYFWIWHFSARRFLSVLSQFLLPSVDLPLSNQESFLKNTSLSF
jgi:hypothetical protein